MSITGLAPKAWLGNYKIFGSPFVNDSTPGDKTFRVTIDSAVYTSVPFGFPPGANIDKDDKDALMTIDDDDADRANQPVAVATPFPP